MKKIIGKLVNKYGAALCALAVAVAPIAVNTCRGKFYQPEEPENLEAFVMANKSEK